MDTKRILVVDDDSGTRLTIRKFLEFSKAADFQVFEAEDGPECLGLATEEGFFDMVLLDIELPGMNGFDVCRALRKVDPALPVIFITSFADVEHRVKGREAGGDSFLPKPIREGPLLSLVKLFMNANRQRR